MIQEVAQWPRWGKHFDKLENAYFNNVFIPNFLKMYCTVRRYNRYKQLCSLNSGKGKGQGTPWQEEGGFGKAVG